MSDWETVGNESEWETVTNNKSSIEKELDRRKQPTRLENLLSKFLPGVMQSESIMSQESPLPRPSRVIGQLADLPINMGMTAIDTLKNYKPMQKLNAEGGKESLGKVKDILSSMGISLATTITHPLQSLKEAPLDVAGDIGTGLGIYKGTTGLLNAIKNPVIKPLLKKLSYTSGVPADDIAKTMDNPGKYAATPLNSKQELSVISGIKDSAVKNLDDLFNFKVKTIEDKVAKAASKYRTGAQTGLEINAPKIKVAVSKYINDMIDRGVISDVPKNISRLYDRIDRYAKRGYTEDGKFLKTLRFEDAHNLKKDLYKIIKDSYGIEDFGDVQAGAYKTAARTINESLRDSAGKVGIDYAGANDAVKSIYDIYDEIGKQGIDTFTGKGATKKFKNWFNDIEGRQTLNKLNNLLPEDSKFMNKLVDFEETQRIRKGWQEPKTGMQNVPFGAGGSVGGATYALTHNAPLSVALGAGSAFASSPRGIRSMILAGSKIPQVSSLASKGALESMLINTLNKATTNAR